VRWASLAVPFAALVGCYDPQVPLGAPCGPMGECPTGQSCDAFTNTCGDASATKTWREDSVSDFSQEGAVFFDTAVEKGAITTLDRDGFVGPVPYATGRVKLSGVAGDMIGADPAAATWANVDGPRTGTSFYPSFYVNYDVLAPKGLGLTDVDNVTVLVEGEIFLDVAGAWRFELDANDAGFVDIAAPGTDFTRLVNSTNAPISATYTVTTPGWYRVRGAFADANQFMDFNFRMDSPAIQGAYRDINADQMRVRVDGIEGAIFDAFDDTYLLRYFGSTLLTVPLNLSLPEDPYNIDVGILSLSMRASGQFLIDKEGDYGFTVTSHHGHRVWIDGQQVANAFSNVDATTNIAPIHLVAGWHDLVFDATKSSDSANLTASIIISTGPDMVGLSLLTDHLRPVPGNVARWTGDSDGTATTITDGASITKTLNMFLPQGATPLGIDSNFTFTHTAQAQVGVVCNPPAGADITWVATGSLGGSGQHVEHNIVPAADAGSTWVLTASDNTVDAVTGTLDLFGVTILYSGGLEPFPTTYRYESAPHELTNITAMGPLRWQTRQGSASKVQFRTCDDASCAGETWVDVSESGAVPAVEVKPFGQYAVEFTGDGTTSTALDWIELAYSSRAFRD
jgi:hypothetical protein